MPVSRTVKATTVFARLSTDDRYVQPPVAARTSSVTPPRSVNLKRVGQQVLENLLQPFGVGVHDARHIRLEVRA